jgi:hypothetical protein
MERKWVIVQDTREKQPLLFPKNLVMLDDTSTPAKRKRVTVAIHVVKRKMDTADYCIEGQEHVCLVERKGSAREITKNLLTARDRARFERELVRLREETANPVLLMEGWPSQLLEDTEASLAVDSLIRTLSLYGTELLLVPASNIRQRRAAGEWVARLLINRSLNGNLNH